MKRKHLIDDTLRVYNYDHTKQRMKERYGLDLTENEYKELCQRIMNRTLVSEIRIEEQKRGTQRTFKLKFKEHEIYVVFLDEGKTITTVLPTSSFERV